MSQGLLVFEALCQAATALERVRDDCALGSAAWCAITELVLGLDTIIDRLIDFPEEDTP